PFTGGELAAHILAALQDLEASK
ncbi:MAG: hypothetical protein QOJ16_2842, partial [Acidobacteriota bacterium]|nr:hypothetical protein [Acidobacteriota bacterium]